MAELAARLAKSIYRELAEAVQPASWFSRAAAAFHGVVGLVALALAVGAFWRGDHALLLLVVGLGGIELIPLVFGPPRQEARRANAAAAQAANEPLIPEDAFRGA